MSEFEKKKNIKNLLGSVFDESENEENISKISFIELTQESHFNSKKLSKFNTMQIPDDFLESESNSENDESNINRKSFIQETQESFCNPKIYLFGSSEFIEDSQPINFKFIEDSQPINTKFIKDSQPINTKFIEDSQPINTKFIEDSQPINTKFIEDSQPINTEETTNIIEDAQLEFSRNISSENSTQDIVCLNETQNLSQIANSHHCQKDSLNLTDIANFNLSLSANKDDETIFEDAPAQEVECTDATFNYSFSSSGQEFKPNKMLTSTCRSLGGNLQGLNKISFDVICDDTDGNGNDTDDESESNSSGSLVWKINFSQNSLTESPLKQDLSLTRMIEKIISNNSLDTSTTNELLSDGQILDVLPYSKKEKSTDCDSALIPLLSVHG